MTDTTTESSDYDAELVVTAMLAAARLTVSDEEKAQMIKDFPLMRASADELYMPELEFYEPAPKFRPSAFYPA